jgi:hypothetical protein
MLLSCNLIPFEPWPGNSSSVCRVHSTGIYPPHCRFCAVKVRLEKDPWLVMSPTHAHIDADNPAQATRLRHYVKLG